MKSTFSISIDSKLDEWLTKNHKKFGFQYKSKLIELAIMQLKDQRDKIPRIRHKYLGIK